MFPLFDTTTLMKQMLPSFIMSIYVLQTNNNISITININLNVVKVLLQKKTTVNRVKGKNVKYITSINQSMIPGEKLCSLWGFCFIFRVGVIYRRDILYILTKVKTIYPSTINTINLSVVYSESYLKTKVRFMTLG